jgi:hypothetical protein
MPHLLKLIQKNNFFGYKLFVKKKLFYFVSSVPSHFFQQTGPFPSKPSRHCL